MVLRDVSVFNYQLIGSVTKLSSPKHRDYNNYYNLILALKHSTFLILYDNIPSIIKHILQYMRIDCSEKSHDTLLTG